MTELFQQMKDGTIVPVASPIDPRTVYQAVALHALISSFPHHHRDRHIREAIFYANEIVTSDEMIDEAKSRDTASKGSDPA